MYDLRNLREMLCKELDEIADKREMSAGDLDAIQKLTSSIKNTYKIEMAEDGGYSRDGEWEADMRGTYGRGSSYRGRRRDAMGRYSRTDARDHMRAHHIVQLRAHMIAGAAGRYDARRGRR